MKTNKNFLLFILSGSLFQPFMAEAEDIADKKPQLSIGLKTWNSSASSYLPGITSGINSAGMPGMINNFESVEGDRNWDVIPSFSVRNKDYFFAASYVRFSTNYSANNVPIGALNGINIFTSRTDHVRRTETDLNAGYYVIPNIALTATYKFGSENRDVMLGVTPAGTEPLSEVKARALLLGLLATYPIDDRFSFYGQFAYGRGRIKYTSRSTKSNVPIDSTVNFNASYIITELGIAYLLPVKNILINQSSIGFGYRSQTIKTFGELIQGNRDLRDVRDGVVLSLNMTF